VKKSLYCNQVSYDVTTVVASGLIRALNVLYLVIAFSGVQGGAYESAC